MVKKIIEWLKPKPEILEQIAHEVSYDGNCPVCKIFNSFLDRKLQSIPFDKMPIFDPKILIECSNCHVAYYGKMNGRKRVLQKYERTSTELLGLKLISEETL